MQKRLRAGTFKFDPQKGVLKSKSSGGKRGIVMASVQNRIVERALLERLQKDVPYVRSVIQTPTSVGGVPNRSVPHGLKIIQRCFEEEKVHYVRSDISAFFDNVPRGIVLNELSKHIADTAFLELLDGASSVALANETKLGEDRRYFPTDDQGVAQGSPLSPLFGNILLSSFDEAMNGRGVVCVRFIDDFVILSDSASKARKAFLAGSRILSDLGLKCADPFGDKPNPEKSSHGNASDGFVFLGYQIEPGLYQPSKRSKSQLLKSIDNCIRDGRYGIEDCLRFENSYINRQRYAQTLDVVDRILTGWGNSFAYSNSMRSLEDLDEKIDEKLGRFRSWFARKIETLDSKGKRRAGGVGLLTDIKSKSLEDVPFVLESTAKRFRTSSRTLNISTDGSVITSGKRNGKDRGPGGWGYVVHETEEKQSGCEDRVTNNSMELKAVIEAIRSQPMDKTLKIHTDSQYVTKGYNSDQPIRSNFQLWRELQELLNVRPPVKIVWVKGHSGDKYNEIADGLANSAAIKLKESLARARKAK
jgi:ribonuclease HI